MRNYRLYQLYALNFGLTFLPKNLNDRQWEVATELMLRALHHEGPAVSHDLIEKHLEKQPMPYLDKLKAVA